jgi:DNA-binding PadR family transcriptional regulator
MHRFHENHHHHERFGRHGLGFSHHGRGEVGRHGGRGRGRSERVFEQGDLRLVLLKLIGEKPSHGYELIKAVEDSVAGAYTPSPGVVYPTLTLLEDLGYAKVEEADGGKKLYAITPEGRTFLESQAAALALLQARIEEVAVAGRGRNAPQVIRAMENLNLSLRMRLSRGPMTEEQVQAVAAALDAAAQAVERA